MSIDSRSVEIRTKSVENILEPLIHQLSLLIGTDEANSRPKGLSRNGDDILNMIKETISEYVEKGNAVASDYPEMASDFKIVLTDIQDTGNHFYRAVSCFIDDPTNLEIQKNIARPARSLLSSVTRLLILADLVDVHFLQVCLNKIKRDADRIACARDQKELDALSASLHKNLSEFTRLLKPRAQDLLDSVQRDDLSLAQFSLRQNADLLILTSKAYLTHPELATIGANHSYAVKITHESIDRVRNACDTVYFPDVPPALQGQAVMEVLKDIMETSRSETENANFRTSSHLYSALEQLSSEISTLTESADLTDHVQTSITESLHHLNDVVKELVEAWEFQSVDELEVHLDDLITACVEVRGSISKAALMLCSESFLAGDALLVPLEQAAKEVNETKLVDAVEKIQQQTTDAIDAALCLCSISDNSNAIRFARFTAMDLENLTPQLINASKALAMRNNSPVALENFRLFSTAYKTLLIRFCTAVDDLTEVFDLLDVLKELLANDIAQCESEAQAGQISNLMRVSRTISARCGRVIEFISVDLSTFDLDSSDLVSITAATDAIGKTLVPKFTQVTKDVCRRIKARERVSIDSIRETGAALQYAFSGLKQSLEKLYSEGSSPLPVTREQKEQDHPTPWQRKDPIQTSTS